ncbi:MAG: GNAT family N-acetyltransferase [Gemmatimonadetes bacterium]|jgi:GNAT superfamily N-acetyltransferase|nr:GNAT family N-acetyltransferase [Gemmatimonadota bacterium]
MPTASKVQTQSQFSECLVYLNERGALWNAYLAGSTIIGWGSPEHLMLVACVDDEVSAFADVLLTPDAPYDFVVHMDADELSSASALLSALPNGLGHFKLHTPILQKHFDQLCQGERRETVINFAVEKDTFRPTTSEYSIQELTSNDEHLFDGCEGSAKGGLYRDDWHVFAIMAQGRVVSSVIIATIINDPLWSKTIAGIGALFTEEPHRQKGLGRALISFVTQQFLQSHDAVLYYTTPDNVASQRLIAPLGYSRSSESIDYQLRLPA